MTDFGLARIEADPGITMTGDVLGTLRYMSPEQSLAKRGLVDQRSDVYSLGATLYELLTLQPAITGKDRQEMLHQIAFDEPRLARQINRAVPADLETIVMKAMAQEPADRYGTAGEVANDLQRFLEHKPIQARRPTLMKRVAKWSRRHRPAVTTAIAVAMVMLFAGFFLVARERAEAIHQRDIAREQQDLALQREKTSRRHLYAADMNLAQVAYRDGHVHRAMELLEYHRPRPDEEDFRGFEWFYLWRLCHADRSTLHGHDGSVTSVAISPDGLTPASGSFDSTVKLWDLATAREIATLTGHREGVWSVSFSPDGQTLATANPDGTVKLWDLAGRECRATLSAHMGPVPAVAYSPNGKTLASAGYDKKCRVRLDAPRTAIQKRWCVQTHPTVCSVRSLQVDHRFAAIS